MKKRSELKLIVILLLVLALAVFGTFCIVEQKQKAKRAATTAAPVSQSESTSAQPTETLPAEPQSESTTQAPVQPVQTETATETQPSSDTSPSLIEDDRPINQETGRIIVDVTNDNWQLVVVNSTREFPATYVPELDEIFDTGKSLDARVTPHYEEMYTAAKNDGIILTPYSAYRSYERQKNNYNNLTESYMRDQNLSRQEAAKKAATVILPPGTSEHNLGLCMDVCNVYDSFVNQKEYTWLTENAYKYGFILRYPKGKEDVTGIVFEPWHWRYVGVEWAKEIRDSGLCLEEFLDAKGIAY